jgi:hypothetical protein
MKRTDRLSVPTAFLPGIPEWWNGKSMEGGKLEDGTSSPNGKSIVGEKRSPPAIKAGGLFL